MYPLRRRLFEVENSTILISLCFGLCRNPTIKLIWLPQKFENLVQLYLTFFLPLLKKKRFPNILQNNFFLSLKQKRRRRKRVRVVRSVSLDWLCIMPGCHIIMWWLTSFFGCLSHAMHVACLPLGTSWPLMTSSTVSKNQSISPPITFLWCFSFFLKQKKRMQSYSYLPTVYFDWLIDLIWLIVSSFILIDWNHR